MFFVCATVVGAVGKFWVLIFLEDLGTRFNDFLKALLPKSGHFDPSAYKPLYTDPVYLFTVFLFYLHSCGNIIGEIDHKSKTNGNYTRLTKKQKNHRK